MTNDGPRPDPESEDEFDLLFANTRPNPTRQGCPPREVLEEMSRAELPIEDDRYLHVVECSPCFRELRAMQQERKARSGPQRD